MACVSQLSIWTRLGTFSILCKHSTIHLYLSEFSWRSLTVTRATWLVMEECTIWRPLKQDGLNSDTDSRKSTGAKAFATEFANAFLQFWWSLPRILTRIQVNPCSIDFPNASQEATELVYAWTTADNLASQRVMQKVGFESYENFDNRRVHWRQRNPFGLRSTHAFSSH